MVVQGPEILDGGNCYDGALVVLPRAVLVVLEEPEGPGILERVLDDLLGVELLGRRGVVDLDAFDFGHQVYHLVLAVLFQMVVLARKRGLNICRRHAATNVVLHVARAKLRSESVTRPACDSRCGKTYALEQY